MALTFPVYQPTYSHSVISASGGAEGGQGNANAKQMTHTSVATDVIGPGALVGLALKHTTNAGASEKVIVRIYRSSDKSDLIFESEITFTSANDMAYVQPDLPIPFFSGIWATVQANHSGGTSAQETVLIKPDVMAIAGNG